MKKILALMLAALAVFTLRANDADDVKATLNKINQLGCELKLAEALQYYAPEYVGVSARGQKVTYADAERIAKAIDVMFDEASSVTAVYKAFAEIQGATLDENQADKARELEKNEELKQAFRNQMNLAKNMMRATLREQAASFKILDVKVSGNNATAICREREADTGKETERACKLVKTNGKWRIVSDQSKYLEMK